MRRTLILLMATFALVSCRPDTIQLTYRYPEAASVSYRMVASARASWDIAGGGSGSYRVVFDITEQIAEGPGDSNIVEVTMSPVEVEEDGLPSPGARDRSFSLQVSPNGEVLEVIEVGGIEARALDPDELAFIGTYRPPLPIEPVTLHDEWSSEQQVRAGATFQEVGTTGKLQALDRDADGRIAQLTYDGDGPLAWTTELPQGEATLTGTAATQTDAVLDIDAGFLRTASSLTQGDFEVTVAAEGQRAPIRGRLRFSLDLELERRAQS